MKLEKRFAPFPAKIRSLNEKTRTITFVASTEAVDRYGDIIRVAGWKFANYLKNPVFLWGHRSGDPPIGKTIKIWTENNPPALVQEVQFATAEIYPWADTIFKLYKSGYLRATSVGFLPLSDPKPRIDQKTGERLGEEYTDQELLELSAVSVPANPEALGRAVQKGILSEAQARQFTNPAPHVADPILWTRFLRELDEEERDSEMISTLDDLMRVLRA
jgi:Escherichia/Staphylococcus phage prohead protease